MSAPVLRDPGPGNPLLFSPIMIPQLPLLHLSEDEKNLIAWLTARAWRGRALMALTNAYYLGEQMITSLGISIPAELDNLRTVVGWPAIAVDPLEERLSGQGFRQPHATDVDEDLNQIWDANDLDAEQSMAHVDALAMGRAWLTVGSSYDPDDDMPVICAESPLNISALWDVRSFQPRAVLQTYWVDYQRHAAVYLPDQTIHIGEDDTGVWQVTDRDQHNFGEVLAVRMANRPRAYNRDGASEITPSVMSLTDAACRTLLGLEVAREFYSVPQRYILGASEQDFQDADGNAKTAWQAYITRILALERDDEGNLPTVGQFQAYDPSSFTKVIDMYASKMSGIIGVPPQDLGLYTEGNPVNADAILYSEQRRNRRAKRKQSLFGPAWIKAIQMAVRIQHNGAALPDDYRRLSMEWADPATPTPAATTDALQKQVASGMVPPTSDVVLARAGYSPVERARLAADRELDQAQQILSELATSLQAKQARTDVAVTNDIAPTPATPPTQTPAANAARKPASDNPRAGQRRLARQ